MLLVEFKKQVRNNEKNSLFNGYRVVQIRSDDSRLVGVARASRNFPAWRKRESLYKAHIATTSPKAMP